MSTLVTRPMDAALAASSEAVIAKKILVLGATSGIAEATCRIWAAQGAQFFLVARNAEKLAAVAADLKLRGASYVGAAVADLDDTEKHAELLTHAVNSLTGMDIAYLAHGILGDQARGEQEFQHAAQIIYTNLCRAGLAADVAGQLLRAAPLRARSRYCHPWRANAGANRITSTPRRRRG